MRGMSASRDYPQSRAVSNWDGPALKFVVRAGQAAAFWGSCDAKTRIETITLQRLKDGSSETQNLPDETRIPPRCRRAQSACLCRGQGFRRIAASAPH